MGDSIACRHGLLVEACWGCTAVRRGEERDAARAEADRLRAQVGRLAEALKFVEWVPSYNHQETERVCSDCGNYESEGHNKTGCDIGFVLSDPVGKASYEEWKAMVAVVKAARALQAGPFPEPPALWKARYATINMALAALNKVRK